ncbi:MAG: carbohydrate ABC transporter permease [Ruminococcus flavefaciens]|nr:carbohydrate ABC transporter permease [Ruminococcus flavefaciens]
MAKREKEREVRKKNFLKQSASRKIFNLCNVAFLGVFAFATLYPFWYLLIVSFNTGRDTLKGGMWFLPRAFTLENFKLALTDDRMFRSLGISVFITFMGVLLGLVLLSLVAYAMSVREFPGKTAFAFFWYFTTICSGGMIPYYLVLRNLKLTSSIWLYIIPGIYGFSRFVMIRTYFQGIPYELRESAELDGAGHLAIMWKIYMPLAKPMLATQGLMIGVGKWNDWFTGAYYQTKAKLYPAATVLRVIMNESLAKSANQLGNDTGTLMLDSTGLTTYTSTSIQYAFVVLLTIPILIAYPFVQKYFVKGMLVGSVKG